MSSAEHFDPLSPAKRALYEIRALKARVADLERQQHEPIAITGVGLRFPGGASDPASFWDLLANGVDAIAEVPASRWSLDAFYHSNADEPGKMYARHGGFLADPVAFDADFFGISPKEAMSLDPQHRLALEVAWEALENAACNPQRLDGTPTGVFFAMSNSDYSRLVFSQTEDINPYSSIGNLFNAAAGRISYFLGLQGPSLVVDTACSGSLVAIHLACQSLHAGECGLALAGGVNLILSPEIHVSFSKSRMMAEDGRCKTFDADADGYVRGEGCGIVVLKRLSDAVAAGDRILAVIRGSAVNQDGRSSGLTAPNGTAQEALIRQALAAAGVEAREIDYVETHGTGTSLGDPIEANALAAALGDSREPGHPLVLGALKTNIGHLEAAAGVAGLIKVVLALQHEEIPRNLHFHTLNPRIDWGRMPAEVAAAPRPWPRTERKRFAGVSSFGFSGTNAHLIIEEAPVTGAVSNDIERPRHVLAISARSASALDQLEARYGRHLRDHQGNFADFCFTANTGRAQFDYRAILLGEAGSAMRGVKRDSPDVVFLFPGQGAQYPGMGRQLYEKQPVFRRAVEECADLLKDELEVPLLDILWGNAQHLLNQTALTQPALFTIEYALNCLWQSWGIRPAAVLGHSAGEFVAACVAGVCSMSDGLKLIATRGRLMQSVAGRGGMTAVAASEERVREALDGFEDRVKIAAFNAPESLVISGYAAELEAVEERLRNQGIHTKRLAASHGFHSPQMTEVAESFARAAENVKWASPGIQLISSLTAHPVGPLEMSDPGYWRRELQEPVQFQQALQALRSSEVFLEVGPGTTLVGLGRQCIQREGILWAPSLRHGVDDWTQVLESLGAMYVRGVDVDWTGFDAPYRRRPMELPTYPFQRRPYWLEDRSALPAPSNWQAIYESASHQSAQCPLDLRLDRYAERWACLEKLSSAYIVAALGKLGIFQDSGDRWSARSLIGQNKVRETYERLMDRWLRRLNAEGLLLADGESFEAREPLPPANIASILAQAEQAFQGDRIFLEYVRACGEKLPEILTGKESPLETLFPGGSFERAEALYERAPLSAYFASIARAALEGFVRSRGGRLKVLEIGAGTGATTSALLPVLPANRATYLFTDLSDAFLNRAEKKFANYPFVRYGIFDAERDEAEQGSFDVIVATNVLHATVNLRRTVSLVRSMLAAGGILILCETTDYLSWYDVTTGLIEGWQRFDDGLRDDHPLLGSSAWTSLLEECGFTPVEAFPAEESPARILGQRVFIARAPSGEATDRVPMIAGSRSAIPRADEGGWIDLSTLAEATAEERHERLVVLVRAHLAAMLRFESPDQIERKRRLMDLGLDSLMAIELRTRLTKSLALEIPLSATLVFDYPTIDEIADHLERDVLGLSSPAGKDAQQERVEELDRLSEQEVEALLLKKLQTL